MRKLIFIPLFAIVLISCKKDKLEKVNLCDSALCTQYYAVWKDIFLTRNNMTEEYFNKHINPYKTEMTSWNEGESFRVSYQVSIDWMICKLEDQFIVNITSETLFPDLTVKRGDYLTESEINQTISAFAFSSSINVIESNDHLDRKSVV